MILRFLNIVLNTSSVLKFYVNCHGLSMFGEVIFGVTAGVCIPALILHVVVFLYCLKQENKTLTYYLYMLLSITDMVFLSCCVGFIYKHRTNRLIYILNYYQWYIVSMSYQESALITSTLTVARVLVITNPFRRIRKWVVFLSLLATSAITSIVTAIPFIAFEERIQVTNGSYINSCLVLLFIIITAVSTGFIIKTLKSSGMNENNEVVERNRRVSVTVISIALAFVVTNLIATIGLLLGISYASAYIDSARFFSFLLNAALNPVIFIFLINKLSCHH